jgi:hypothetical protein
MTKPFRWFASLTPLALVVAFLAGRVLASGAPTKTPLTWAVTLTDATGKPYPTAQDVTLAFFDASSGGAMKCQAPTIKSEAGTGRFGVVLPAACADAVHLTPDLWSEAAVGDGKTVLPRVHVGAVPYALEADVASNAAGVLKLQVDSIKADTAANKSAIDGLKSGGGGPSGKIAALGLKVNEPQTLQGNGRPVAFLFTGFVTSTVGGIISGTKLQLMVDGTAIATGYAVPSPQSTGFLAPRVFRPRCSLRRTARSLSPIATSS